MTQPNDNVPYGFCHCGCGERTALSKRNRPEVPIRIGEPRRFINGHQYAKAPFYEVDSVTGCWNWQRATHGSHVPYGVIIRNGKRMPAHRFMYEKLRGPIPDGLVLHHKCENTLCVNPDHLEPVTHRRNIYVSRITKLSDAQVAEIRALPADLSHAEIARRYGVTYPTISVIRRGKHRLHDGT